MTSISFLEPQHEESPYIPSDITAPNIMNPDEGMRNRRVAKKAMPSSQVNTLTS
jgi:hypothetical protein